MMKLDRTSSDLDIFGLFRNNSQQNQQPKEDPDNVHNLKASSGGESDDDSKNPSRSSSPELQQSGEYHLDEDHRLQGYVKKRSFLGSWKKYYFVLNAPSMEIIYYKSRRDYWNKEKASGSIDLTGASAKMCHLNEKENMFVIFYPEEGTNEVIYLWPPTEAERKTWVDAVNKLTLYESVTPLTNSSTPSPCNSVPTSPNTSAPPSPRASR